VRSTRNWLLSNGLPQRGNNKKRTVKRPRETSPCRLDRKKQTRKEIEPSKTGGRLLVSRKREEEEAEGGSVGVNQEKGKRDGSEERRKKQQR
jgi:hypothetical protein